MRPYDRIMLPTAFSTLSKRASANTIPLARQFGSEVHLVHVVPHTQLVADPGSGLMGESAAFPIAGPSASELVERSRRELDAFAGEVLGEIREQVRPFAYVGGIVEELLRHAQSHSIDLITMGTHADGMLKRVVFGSIGKSVLEHSPCPVLLVPVKDAKR
ncbi:MAG: universal stress protein [Phycisphaerales bacterium]